MKTTLAIMVMGWALAANTDAATHFWANGKYEWQDNSWISTTNDNVSIGYATHPVTNATANVCKDINVKDLSSGLLGLLPQDFSIVGGELLCNALYINGKSNVQNVVRLVGGTFSNATQVIVYDPLGMSNTLQVVGSGCTFKGTWNVALNWTGSGSAGQIEFVIDSTGISAVPGNLNFGQSSAAISLVSDGASTGTYDLVGGDVKNPANITWRLADPSPYTWVTNNFTLSGEIGLVDLRPKGTVVAIK